MNGLRFWIGLSTAALVAAVAGMPATAIAAPAPAPFLGATNVLTASRPVVADVRLARPATVATPFGDSPDLAVAGGGRLATFALVGQDGSTKGVTVVGGALGGKSRFLLPLPQFPAPGGGSFEVVKTFADTTSLPAGSYRLYLVPDGAPVRMTLRLQGLTGTRTVAATRRAVAEVAPGTAWPADAPTSANVFAASSARHLAGRGLALHVLRSTLDGEVAWQLVMCHDNPLSPAVPPVPGCPNGEKHSLTDHRAPDLSPDAKLFVQGFAGLPAGDHGLSVVYTNEARATAVQYLTLWLTY
jgi:hypothetical protein